MKEEVTIQLYYLFYIIVTNIMFPNTLIYLV